MLRFALRNLLTRPLRSLLSLLGLTVAIVGMIGLFSVAEGIDDMVSSTFARIPGLVVMQPGAPIPLFSRLPVAWGDDIATLPGVHVVNRELWARAHIIEGKPIISPPRFLFGTDIDTRLRMRQCVYRNALVAGRFLTATDRGTLNCFVSRQIAEEFHVGVGDALKVDGYPLQVVGIYHTGSLLLDVAILLDIGQVQQLARTDGDIVSCFYVEPEPAADRDQLIQGIKDRLRGRSLAAWEPASALGLLSAGGTAGGNPIAGLASALDRMLKGGGTKNTTIPVPREEAAPQPEPPSRTGSVGKSAPAKASKDAEEELAVEVRGAEDWTEEFQKFSADLDIFLFIMTSIGVTIAVLSIVNTMLMSVTERIIEFGILKANGWSNGNVLQLVTLESALLGIGGGVLGSTLGWIVTLAVNAQWPTRIHLHASFGLLAFGVVFSTVLGVLGGLYPAIWASRMMPMDAIRRG